MRVSIKCRAHACPGAGGRRGGRDQRRRVIRFDVEGRVAIIRLDRVEARNAINPAMAEAIEAAIDRLEADDDLWLGVLSHEGPVFCAGADLKEVAAGNGAKLGTARGGFGGIVLRERVK